MWTIKVLCSRRKTAMMRFISEILWVLMTYHDSSGQTMNGYVLYRISNISPVHSRFYQSGDVYQSAGLRDHGMESLCDMWPVPTQWQIKKWLKIYLQDISNHRVIFNKVKFSTTLQKMLQMNSEITSLTTIDFDSGNMVSYGWWAKLQVILNLSHLGCSESCIQSDISQF